MNTDEETIKCCSRGYSWPSTEGPINWLTVGKQATHC